MSMHFRDGKVIFLDADFVEWEVTPTDTITTAPDEHGLARRIRLDNHILMLRRIPNQPKDDKTT